MKKMLSLVLSFLLLASLCPALADTPPADQIATSGASYVEWYDRTRASEDERFIDYIKSGIDAGTNSVFILGKTETNEIVYTIGVVFYVQQWKNAKWNDYYILNTQAYDTDVFFYTKTVDVESGYYYRLYTIHKAYKGTETDLVSITTSSVYVN